ISSLTARRRARPRGREPVGQIPALRCGVATPFTSLMTFRLKLLSILKSILMPLRIQWALRGRRSPYIVQVGANDGESADPMFRTIQKSRHWRAMLIEPVPHMFERLKLNYAGVDRCALVNVAIAPTAGTLPIYYVDPKAKEIMPEIPDYYEQLPSFDKQM